MKKLLLVTSACAAALLTANTAYADPGEVYVEFLLGVPITRTVDHTVVGPGGVIIAPKGPYEPSGRRPGFGGAFGYHFDANWRAEVAVGVTTGENGTYFALPHMGKFTAYSVMGNVLYSFDTETPIKPFVGVGLGAAIVDVNGVGAVGGGFTVNDSDSAVAASFILGLDYELTENVTLTGRYTGGYVGSMDFNTTAAGITTQQDSFFGHTVGFGVRFSF